MITVIVVYWLSCLCHLTRETLFWVLLTHIHTHTYAPSSAALLLVIVRAVLIQKSASVSVQYQ